MYSFENKEQMKETESLITKYVVYSCKNLFLLLECNLPTQCNSPV